MQSKDELQQMHMNDLSCIDKDSLVDILSVKIDTELPKEQRIADFIKQIKNPYLFKCGDMVVQSIFPDTEATLTDRLKQYLKIV